MDFEIKDLEIIDAENSRTVMAATTSNHAATQANSIILNELHKENEETQNKLKLTYRRLLLFETENNRLVEEKNKLFFEAQNYFQKNQMLTEKIEALEKTNTQNENSQKLLIEKVSSLETINRTQLTEIKRYSKFHAKIQEVVKPLVLKLKTQISELNTELVRASRVNANLNATLTETTRSTELELNKRANQINNLISEKTGMTAAYEEQIHSFSKEILDLQSKNDEQQKEISRLKKAVEFKNYFENEVIRFKRTHEEDQNQLNELIQKKSATEAELLAAREKLSAVTSDLASLRTRSSDLEMNLDVTRTTLAKKIDEITNANERLARLEKLNNQLSQEISNTIQN
jgi:chromosome segregation ATPase